VAIAESITGQTLFNKAKGGDHRHVPDWDRSLLMPDWFIPIEGTIANFSRETLEAFGLEIQVADGEKSFATCAALKGLPTRDDASTATAQILDPFNGYVQLSWPGVPPASFTWLLSRERDGTERRWITAVGSIFIVGQPEGETPKPLWELAAPTAGYQAVVPRNVVPALQHAEVRRALSIHGKGAGVWWALYAVYEVVKNSIGGWDVMVAKGWATEEQLNRFRASANDPRIAGVYSRHGIPRDASKFQPLALGEARGIIQRILVQWMAEML
jgi:hypothetical protein